MSRLGMNVGFHLFGPWVDVERKIQRLRPSIYQSMLLGQKEAAQKLVNIVKGHLNNQDIPGWEPLKHPEKSHDWRILVDYETYLDNIKTWQSGKVRYIGVKRGVTEDNGIETARVAAIHEFWSLTGSGPYRPLWKPSIEEIGAGKGITKIIKNAIKRRFQIEGWNVKES